jgi:hypothetical protein
MAVNRPFDRRRDGQSTQHVCAVSDGGPAAISWRLSRQHAHRRLRAAALLARRRSLARYNFIFRGALVVEAFAALIYHRSTGSHWSAIASAARPGDSAADLISAAAFSNPRKSPRPKLIRFCPDVARAFTSGKACALGHPPTAHPPSAIRRVEPPFLGVSMWQRMAGIDGVDARRDET